MTHPFYPPNYALSYDGHIHDVSYILSCDGLINEPGYRLGEISDLNRDLIVETMEFISTIYGPRYAPKWEGTRLVFDAIKIKHGEFVRRFRKNVKSYDVERWIDGDGRRSWFVSPTSSFMEAWRIFYVDVATDSVYLNFLDAVLLSNDDMVSRYDEDPDDED